MYTFPLVSNAITRTWTSWMSTKHRPGQVPKFHIGMTWYTLLLYHRTFSLLSFLFLLDTAKYIISGGHGQTGQEGAGPRRGIIVFNGLLSFATQDLGVGRDQVQSLGWMVYGTSLHGPEKWLRKVLELRDGMDPVQSTGRPDAWSMMCICVR